MSHKLANHLRDCAQPPVADDSSPVQLDNDSEEAAAVRVPDRLSPPQFIKLGAHHRTPMTVQSGVNVPLLQGSLNARAKECTQPEEETLGHDPSILDRVHRPFILRLLRGVKVHHFGCFLATSWALQSITVNECPFSLRPGISSLGYIRQELRMSDGFRRRRLLIATRRLHLR